MQAPSEPDGAADDRYLMSRVPPRSCAIPRAFGQEEAVPKPFSVPEGFGIARHTAWRGIARRTA
jgi:hypothetical protein